MAKAQGISINVIVVAAIALLVLVVLSVMFVGKIGIFSGKSVSCSDQGGSCQIDQCPAGMRQYTAWSCPKTAEGADQKCCIVGA